MSFFNFFLTLRVVCFYFQKIKLESFKNILNSFYFLNRYYLLNDLIWQEGFLIDFLQKKLTDSFIRKFLITSSYLFNERLIFDKFIRFFLILIIQPAHKFFIFESENVVNLLFLILFIFFILYCLFFYTYVLLLLMF